jgi:hypothetical protein
MYKTIFLRCMCFVFLSITSFCQSKAEDKEYIAIIPVFHDRLNTSGFESSLRLQSQQFVLFVYQNGVVVYSEANFINTGIDSFSQEFALPSKGHDENGSLPGGRISTGIMSAQLWLQGKKIVPEVINDGNEDWYTIRTHFAPGEQCKVKALFWVQTSLEEVDVMPGFDTVTIEDGKRGFMVDLAHAAIWNREIESININTVLLQGVNATDESFTAVPKTYELQNSTLLWKLYEVEPSLDDNVLVFYSSFGDQTLKYNTIEKLSTYFVKSVYDNLVNYAKKILEE